MYIYEKLQLVSKPNCRDLHLIPCYYFMDGEFGISLPLDRDNPNSASLLS